MVNANTKGATGERAVEQYLKANGWFIADKETSGLAGDDIFAQSPAVSWRGYPASTWFAIEVKHVRSLKPDNRHQAIRQGHERADKIKAALETDCVATRLGITFNAKNWLLVWKASGYNNGTDFIVMRHGGAKTKYEIWE